MVIGCILEGRLSRFCGQNSSLIAEARQGNTFLCLIDCQQSIYIPAHVLLIDINLKRCILMWSKVGEILLLHRPIPVHEFVISGVCWNTGSWKVISIMSIAPRRFGKYELQERLGRGGMA